MRCNTLLEHITQGCVRLANDYDTDTLIQDGSNMCWTSGPAGMSDGGTTPRKKQRTSD